jgi:hypothetical protein
MEPTRTLEAGSMVGPRGGSSAVAAAGVLIGGALALLGSVVTWARVSPGGGLTSSGLRGILRKVLGRRLAGRAGRGLQGGSRIPARLASRSIGGLQTLDGRLVLALGIALILIAVLAFATRWELLYGAAGAIAAAVAVIGLVVAASALAHSPGGTLSPFLDQLPIGPTVSTGIGVYISLVGAALALAAGIAAFLTASPPRLDRSVVAPAPPGTTYPAVAPAAPPGPPAAGAPTEPFTPPVVE